MTNAKIRLQASILNTDNTDYSMVLRGARCLLLADYCQSSLLSYYQWFNLFQQHVSIKMCG